MIKLKADLGAVEGQVVNTALLTALDHVWNGDAGQIHIDGKFRLAGGIYRNFLSTQGAKRHHLIISGEGAASQLIPDYGWNEQGISLHNLESLVLKDFIFSGDPLKNPQNGQFDCGVILVCGTINQVEWHNVHAYGIASRKENTLGLFHFDNCGFTQTGGQTRGTTTVDASVFNFLHARKTHIRGPEVMDYGMNEAWYASKTAIGFSHSWYRFIAPHQGEAYLGMPVLEHMTLDEGARYGVSCDGGTGWMRGVKLSDISINVRDAGVKLNRVGSAVLEDVCFTYRGGVPAILGNDVKRTRLTRCLADKPNTGITLTGQVDKLTLDESYGFDPISFPEGTDFTTTN